MFEIPGGYPPTPAVDVIDDFHGTPVADPYRWLEEHHSDQTRNWVAAQGALTEAALAQVPAREEIRARLSELWDFPRYSAATRRGDRLFFSKNDGLLEQPIVYRQHGLDGEPQMLLDPNTLSEDGAVAVINQSYSHDGRLLGYATAESGSDWQVIRVRDTTTGADLADVVRWVKFTPIAWAPDDRGFFYARYPQPDDVLGRPPTDQKVYFHRLGDDQSSDELVYERPDAPELGFLPIVTEDHAFLVLHVWHGTDVENRIYYRRLGEEGPVVRLLDEADARYQFVGNGGGRFYFFTNLDAPRGRIVAIDVADPDRDGWEEIVPEGEDAIEAVTMTGDRFLVLYVHHARHRISVFGLDGHPAGDLELPGLGSVIEIAGRRQDPDVFITFHSHLRPPTVLRHQRERDENTVWRASEIEADVSDFVTEQLFAASPDGTEIPMFVTRRRDLEMTGDHATLLYGYGGFDISLTPTFSISRLVFLERGGIIVDANLRGGGEYGEAWHEAGMLDRKQNVFDDFAAVAEHLIQAGYTSPGRLAIMGGSNGGLLVAATMLQRPDLFGAVVCAVPVADMLRYHRFTAGRYWTGEYGNAEESADHFRFLHAYSPIHNVRPDTGYPPILIVTADTDDRVVPMHAFKLAATLQASDTPNPVLLRVEGRAGHGLGKPTSKLIAEATDIYSFLAATIGA